MESVETLVIGAGPCGLGAALGLAVTARSTDWQLVEAANVAGGLASSVTDPAGFTWDYGGHVTFSQIAVFTEVMTALLGDDGWNQVERRAWALISNEWVRYPVQHHWPRGGSDGVVNQMRAVPLDGSFENWARHEFGEEITEIFLRPYNEKLWKVGLADLGCQWIDERVARRESASGHPWGPNATFLYPRRGGAGAPWRRLAKVLADAGNRMCFGRRVVGVDLERRLASIDDGTAIRFGVLVSTMPVDRLVEIVDAPAEIRERAKELVRTRVTLVGIGLEGAPPAHLPEFSWLYFPDPELPFYRLSQVSAYADANTPGPGYWSLLAECSSSPAADASPIAEEVVAALRCLGVVTSESRIVSTWQAKLEYGYPVPTLTRDIPLEAILNWLRDHGCLSCGRFGGWRYEKSNQDHAFHSGFTTALDLSRAELAAAIKSARILLLRSRGSS